ncbi:hypothetical protein AB6A40_011382 [Gnathostoma spinigerum]|uniref:Hyaluronidase n=1 Tax=Gnathostoma spinigerum TaxID=75299 RepID=A0ABD6F3F4_9BILA
MIAEITLFFFQLPFVFNFEVIWNVPSEICLSKSIDIPLDEYGIKHNVNQRFEGEEVVLFYSYKFGRYPYYYHHNASEPKNGGLPQKVNMTDHLAKAEKDIKIAIPNENFTGVAILDFEEWRPTYETNWSAKRVYRNESIKYAEEHCNSTCNATAVAIEEFDSAAK